MSVRSRYPGGGGQPAALQAGKEGPGRYLLVSMRRASRGRAGAGAGAAAAGPRLGLASFMRLLSLPRPRDPLAAAFIFAAFSSLGLSFSRAATVHCRPKVSARSRPQNTGGSVVSCAVPRELLRYGFELSRRIRGFAGSLL